RTPVGGQEGNRRLQGGREKTPPSGGTTTGLRRRHPCLLRPVVQRPLVGPSRRARAWALGAARGDPKGVRGRRGDGRTLGTARRPGRGEPQRGRGRFRVRASGGGTGNIGR